MKIKQNLILVYLCVVYRKELVEKINSLPSMRDVIFLEDKYTTRSYPYVDSVVAPDRKSNVQQVDGKSA
jgi:hypothetical protein